MSTPAQSGRGDVILLKLAPELKYRYLSATGTRKFAASLWKTPMFSRLCSSRYWLSPSEGRSAHILTSSVRTPLLLLVRTRSVEFHPPLRDFSFRKLVTPAGRQ